MIFYLRCTLVALKEVYFPNTDYYGLCYVTSKK